jgi:hypothetical protein
MTDEVKRGFKRKTIARTIHNKMEHWLKSIEGDDDLVNAIRKDYIVTGGAIASMVIGDLPNDFDVYFRTTETAKRVAEYYINRCKVKNDKIGEPFVKVDEGRVAIYVKSAGIIRGEDDGAEDYDYFEMRDPASAEVYLNEVKTGVRGKYEVAMVSTNAISLRGDVQLIMRFCGEPEVIHENYDFVHCTNWYTHNGGLVLRQPALESLLSRELKYVGSKYPVCSMFRLKKFIKRGWTITAGEMLKIAWDISELDLHNPDVLQEQLTGVDAAYFNQVMTALKGRKDIDRTYLYEIINRVFDDFEDETIEGLIAHNNVED